MTRKKPIKTPIETPAELPATGHIRLAQLVKLIPFSTATVWRKVKAGEFPKPVKLSKRVTAWKAEDIHAWINRDRTAPEGSPVKRKRAAQAATGASA